uniref:ribosomal protein L9 n=1 Tax=Galdieria phlegrea TaxID=1389228 RepID=UPI0023D8421D|nr:ribosomal protein L9 [Galdieria phlegrea]UNJ16259.1 ribosomal protein L9 [Galdieria sp.]WDA99689.1 ribosomal protein L9 [Galdieria sulphuraria]WDA99881.1 ribosomal protein L9 [Galdieria phlegrea]
MKKNKRHIEVFLYHDIKSLAQKGSIIKVAPGYARNYLIPQNLAEIVNENNLKKFINIQNRIKNKEKTLENYFNNLKLYINQIYILNIKKKAGKNGLIFGRINEKEIVKLIYDLTKYQINKKQISMPEIKYIGTYKVTLNLMNGINAIIQVQIIPY